MSMIVKTPGTPFYKRLTEGLDALNTPKGMRKFRLHLVDIHMIWHCCKEAFLNGETETISQAVASWFKSYGFLVMEKGIGWSIQIPEKEKKGIVVEK